MGCRGGNKIKFKYTHKEIDGYATIFEKELYFIPIDHIQTDEARLNMSGKYINKNTLIANKYKISHSS